MPASLYRTIVRSIDLTSLSGDETEATINDMVKSANEGAGGITVAAVCVYPKYCTLIKKSLMPGIKTAIVAPGFPTGVFNEEQLDNFAVNCNLADEIDVVIDPNLARKESWKEYTKVVSYWRNLTQGKVLKVIIESGELSAEQIIHATEIVSQSGADFVKTSTGKTKTGFTKEALITICSVVKDHFKKTGKRLGIKASGGIKTYGQAVEIASIVSENLGNDWLVPATFRIGASSLYDTLKNHGGHQ